MVLKAIKSRIPTKVIKGKFPNRPSYIPKLDTIGTSKLILVCGFSRCLNIL